MSLGWVISCLNMAVVLLSIANTATAVHFQGATNKGDIDQVSQKYQDICEYDLDVDTEDITQYDLDYEHPCPEADDIAPCVCTYYDRINVMNMNCTDIESEEEIKRVFESFFPFTNFTRFLMIENKQLKVLRDFVFGDVSFEEFLITDNALKIIESRAFNGSYETATDLRIFRNNLTYFPSGHIKYFSALRYFDISDNHFDPFPLASLHDLPTLEYIMISNNDGNFTGTFQNIPNLTFLEVARNNLSTIPASFFKTHSHNLDWIALWENQVVSVAPNAFDIKANLTIDLSSNLLTTLEEDTWRPLFEGAVDLDAWDNPLDCGCDLAWLFGEDHLLDHLRVGAACPDGTKVHDLDPEIFDQC